MAITLINRPLGHRLSSTQLQGVGYDDGGDLLIYTGTGHGLSDGDYVYIESNIGSYSGFRYVDSIAYDSFKVRESETGPYIQFVQEADIQFYISVLQHGWQCVHLPIVYELESDLSPSNTAEEEYTPNVVDSFEANAGYVQLNLSASLSNPTALSKIELLGGGMAGVYQIVTVLQPWSVLIDLAYNAGYDFSGSSVVKYYDNYAINVDVYAGLDPSHPWQSYKPYELAATLKLIPDSNNRVKFSIAEILKGYIETRNKLDLDTLPNNLDFMTGFYISYYETYDESDGETITNFTGDITTDNEGGEAVNAMLEFKNQHSGFLSDYITGGGAYLGQWLTHQDRPVLVVGLFMDLSFINRFTSDVIITIIKSLSGIVLDTEEITYENPGIGVLRIPIEGESGYDEYCVQASTAGQDEVPGVTSAISLPALEDWTQTSNPSLADWVIDSSPSVDLPSNPFGNSTSEDLSAPFAFVPGNSYTINFSGTLATANIVTIRIAITSADGTIITSKTGGAGATWGDSITFLATEGMARVSVRVVLSLSLTGGTLTITSRSGTVTTPTIPAIPEQTLTEEICIDIIEECGSTLDSPLRITEAENLRRLE